MRLIVLLLLTVVSLRAESAQRIVSTTPSITETLFAMGLGSRVVGDTIYCNYPPAAVKLPKIGSLLKPDVEAIVALHPDLVVVEKKYSNHLTDQLELLHIRYALFESSNLQTIYAGAREIGKAANAETAAEQFIQNTQSVLQAVKNQTASLPKPRVVFLVGHSGGRLEGLIAGAAGSYFSDLIGIAGGVDIFSDASAPYARVSLEEILSRNPDVILQLSGESQEKQEEVVSLWKEHSSINAVRNGRVYALPPGPFLIPGPRAAEAVRTLAHLLHPELKQ
jgi:iron complex transport system substrate-binding protein